MNRSDCRVIVEQVPRVTASASRRPRSGGFWRVGASPALAGKSFGFRRGDYASSIRHSPSRFQLAISRISHPLSF
jgi:hypothetical protein